MNAQACFVDLKTEQLEASEQINAAALDAGLALASMGLSSSASLGRMLASRAIANEKAAARVSKIGKTAGRAGQVMVDATSVAVEMNQAIDACDQASTPTPGTNSAATAKPSWPSCEINNFYLGSQEGDNFVACMGFVTLTGLSAGQLSLTKVRAAMMDPKSANLDEETQKRLAKFLDTQEDFSRTKKADTLGAASDLSKKSLAGPQAFGDQLSEADFNGNLSPAFLKKRDEIYSRNISKDLINASDLASIKTFKGTGLNHYKLEEGILNGERVFIKYPKGDPRNHALAILETGKKLEQLGIDPVDLQYVLKKDGTVRVIDPEKFAMVKPGSGASDESTSLAEILLANIGSRNLKDNGLADNEIRDLKEIGHRLPAKERVDYFDSLSCLNSEQLSSLVDKANDFYGGDGNLNSRTQKFRDSYQQWKVNKGSCR
jgi:hypothetical protein